MLRMMPKVTQSLVDAMRRCDTMGTRELNSDKMGSVVESENWLTTRRFLARFCAGFGVLAGQRAGQGRAKAGEVEEPSSGRKKPHPSSGTLPSCPNRARWLKLQPDASLPG